MSGEENQGKILVIDDERVLRSCLRYYLEDFGYDIIEAENGREGLEKIEAEKPDVVLTDLRMPEVDGLDVLKKSKELYPDLPVIVVSGTGRIHDVVDALHFGAWDYLVKPVEDMSIVEHLVRNAVEQANLIKKNNEYKMHLEELVEERTKRYEQANYQLEYSRMQIIAILSQAAEYKDFETGNHFMRVANMCGIIAKGLDWSESDVQCIKLASPVHDIGKIGIRDDILLKPGPLEKAEWEEMKQHCNYGKSILTGKFLSDFSYMTGFNKNENICKCSMLNNAAFIAMCHHEHWDGSGYPEGISGETIPFEARVTAVADVYDAIRSKRPYKKPWSEEKSLEYMNDNSGKKFDPEVIEVFCRNIDEIRKISSKYQDM